MNGTSMSDIVLDDEHPLHLELASLRAAAARYQHEAHVVSIKLQRHSFETSLAVEHTHVLEQENIRLREEVETLRSTPETPPQATALQVSALTLALRKLSDKLTFTEETLLARSTELTHSKSELTRTRYDIDVVTMLARRANARAEELERRERELERKVRAAQEERKLSDMVVGEYAALVRNLEGRPSRGSIASLGNKGTSSSQASLTDGLAEGRAGLKRLLGEFNDEIESVVSELSKSRSENEFLLSTLQVERQRSEADRESLANVLLELDKYKADDNTATKMVSRYMKFSQSSTDALQQSMDNLRARQVSTIATLNTQIDHLHKALLSERRQSEKLRDALDQLSEDISREAYGRRREISLRLAFLGREEALAESLRRWLRRSKESTNRALSYGYEPHAATSTLQDVFEKVLRDAEGLLETLNGQPTAEGLPPHGSIARILAAQSAVSVLNRELQDETHKRLEAQRKFSNMEMAIADAVSENNQAEAPLTPPQSTSSLSLSAEHVDTEPAIQKDLPAVPGVGGLASAAEGHLEEMPEGPEVVVQEVRTEVIRLASPPSQASETSASPISSVPASLESNEPPPETHSQDNEPVTPTLDVTALYSPSTTPHPSGSPPSIPQTPHIDDAQVPEAQSHVLVSNLEPAVEVEENRPIGDALQSPASSPMVLASKSPAGVQILHHPQPKTLITSPAIQELLDLDVLDQNTTPVITVEPVLSDESMEDVPTSVTSLAPSLAVEVASSAPVDLSTTTIPVAPTAPHPLLAELDHAKHRYDELQKSFRGCNLALKELKKDTENLPTSHAMSAVIRTALERLNDFNEDARVELEIRVSDEERMISGYETLLFVPGALLSDEVDEQEMVAEIEGFVSGTSNSVSRALGQFNRKLDDLQHDIASLKRSLHELASGEASLPGPEAPTKSPQGWSSWTGGLLGGPSRPVSPAPTFGSVITTPRGRQSSFSSFLHRPSLPNLHSAPSNNLTPGDCDRENPFASLGLRLPMPAHALPQTSPTNGMFLSPGFSPSAARPQKPRVASASMYMLGLGARSTGYALPQSVKSPSSKLANTAKGSEPDSQAGEGDANSDVE